MFAHIRDLMSALEKWKGSLLIDRGPAPPPRPPPVSLLLSCSHLIPLLFSFTDLDVEGWSHRAATDRRGAFHCLVDGEADTNGGRCCGWEDAGNEMEEAAT